MAMAIARRTRTSSSGFFLLLMATTVLARVPPTSTWKRLSAWNCARLRAADTRGNRSTSPASRAATWAAASLMKRTVTRRSATAFTSRKPSQRASTRLLPLAQLSSLKGPVPTGWVLLLATLLGSTITAVAWPIWNRKSGLVFFSVTTTVRSSVARMLTMLANTALSLLVLSAAAARSKANFTVAALNGSPLWNFTPGRRVKAQVLLSGVTVQLVASKGAMVESARILVSVSSTLYCTTSAMADAAPAVGSRPGGSSVMASTRLSFLPWAQAAGARPARVVAAAAAVRAVRRWIMVGLLRSGTGRQPC